MISKSSEQSRRPNALLDEAKISPSTVYDHPRQVVHSNVLTTQQKADVLEQWESDAIAMQTASEEGMTGGAPSRLDDVHKAQTELREITAGRGAEHGRRVGIGNNDNDRDHDQRTEITVREARQGVTGHNVRYVLAVSILGAIVALFLLSRFLANF